jgi:chemotaxis protein methyltransferase CheR
VQTPPGPELSVEDFEKFRDFFYRKTGIYFDESKRYFVDKRIFQRMEETENSTFREYFSFMRFQASQQEYQQVVNLMTVNETYFFREEYQLKCMVGPVLDEIARRSRGAAPIRILSIPCSTGEEPYSIALYLIEFWPRLADFDVQIYGADIDTNVLAQCKAGVFSSRSIQYLPRAILGRHFQPLPQERYLLSQDLRDCVEFTHVNLADPLQMLRLRNFDLIFCRNLLIYFDDASRRKAAESFYDALKPGGFIFLGHSESMSRMSSLFKVRKFDDAIAYQKPQT